ncbi:MAG: hypothetical protein QOF62_2319 [Pyrinomonadaceae bacterium]|nr:hypothetical protein [Pyrinomonadaceae bacterium]
MSEAGWFSCFAARRNEPDAPSRSHWDRGRPAMRRQTLLRWRESCLRNSFRATRSLRARRPRSPVMSEEGSGFSEFCYLEFRSSWMGANDRVVCSVTLDLGSGNARAWAASSSFVTCSFGRGASCLASTRRLPWSNSRRNTPSKRSNTRKGNSVKPRTLSAGKPSTDFIIPISSVIATMPRMKTPAIADTRSSGLTAGTSGALSPVPPNLAPQKLQ